MALPAGDEDAIGRGAGVHGADDEFGITDVVALRGANSLDQGVLREDVGHRVRRERQRLPVGAIVREVVSHLSAKEVLVISLDVCCGEGCDHGGEGDGSCLGFLQCGSHNVYVHDRLHRVNPSYSVGKVLR